MGDKLEASRPGFWLAVTVLALLLLALQFGGDSTIDALRYQRAAIASGQWWRLLTGNLVHAGWPHLSINLAGLLITAVLTRSVFSTTGWLFVFGTSTLATTTALWIWTPAVAWYLGASGALHGMLAGGALLLIRQRNVTGWILAALIVLKLAWEQTLGPLPGSEATVGVAVLTSAHLYGAAGGALSALVWMWAAVKRDTQKHG